MTKVGRKQKVYEQKEIDKIINEYVEKEGLFGTLEYLKVHRYALKMHEEGELEYKLSEDFWRKPNRQGRITIDKYNEIIEDNISESRKREINIVNTERAVAKSKGKEQMLISLLKPNEEQLKHYVEMEIELMKKNKELEEENKKLREKNSELKEKNELYQKVVFQLFEYGTSADVSLVNMLNTGKTKHKRVKNAFDKIFESPTEFMDGFEKEKGKKEGNKVLDIGIKKSNIADDYDF